jgi:hypothetical protein
MTGLSSVGRVWAWSPEGELLQDVKRNAVDQAARAAAIRAVSDGTALA